MVMDQVEIMAATQVAMAATVVDMDPVVVMVDPAVAMAISAAVPAEVIMETPVAQAETMVVQADMVQEVVVHTVVMKAVTATHAEDMAAHAVDMMKEIMIRDMGIRVAMAIAADIPIATNTAIMGPVKAEAEEKADQVGVVNMAIAKTMAEVIHGIAVMMEIMIPAAEIMKIMRVAEVITVTPGMRIMILPDTEVRAMAARAAMVTAWMKIMMKAEVQAKVLLHVKEGNHEIVNPIFQLIKNPLRRGFFILMNSANSLRL